MKRNQKIKLYLFSMMVALTLGFALLFPRLTLPFGFSYIIYLMLRPLTVKLTSGPMKQRSLFFGLLALGLFFLMFPFLATIYNTETDLMSLSQKLPAVQKILQDKFFLIKVKFFEKYGIRLNLDPVNYMVSKAEVYGTNLLATIPAYLSSIFEWLLLVPLFLYFFFRESSHFKQLMMTAIPNQIFEKAYVLSSHFNTKFSEYIIAKFIEATIVGTLITVSLLVIGFPYPFILGFIAGVTNILPYIGPIIGFLPAFFIALLSQDPDITMWRMIIVYGIANLIDMVLVFPLLVSKIVNLHPIIVVVSIIVGSQLGGIIGMIVIIPFIAFFKILFKEIYKDLSVQV